VFHYLHSSKLYQMNCLKLVAVNHVQNWNKQWTTTVKRKESGPKYKRNKLVAMHYCFTDKLSFHFYNIETEFCLKSTKNFQEAAETAATTDPLIVSIYFYLLVYLPIKHRHPLVRKSANNSGDLIHVYYTLQQAGLPDLSCYNIPKRGKYTKWPRNYQVAIKYSKC
jgi:hypothetical protein